MRRASELKGKKAERVKGEEGSSGAPGTGEESRSGDSE